MEELEKKVAAISDELAEQRRANEEVKRKLEEKDHEILVFQQENTHLLVRVEELEGKPRRSISSGSIDIWAQTDGKEEPEKTSEGIKEEEGREDEMPPDYGGDESDGSEILCNASQRDSENSNKSVVLRAAEGSSEETNSSDLWAEETESDRSEKIRNAARLAAQEAPAHKGRQDSRQGWREGDWRCFECKRRNPVHNYASRLECRVCGTPKAEQTRPWHWRKEKDAAKDDEKDPWGKGDGSKDKLQEKPQELEKVPESTAEVAEKGKDEEVAEKTPPWQKKRPGETEEQLKVRLEAVAQHARKKSEESGSQQKRAAAKKQRKQY